MNSAIGLIEVVGLANAIVVADTMAKVASVELLGVEKAKGGGWMTIKITGDVSAVTASIDAGAAKANESHSLVSQKVIPRPAEGLGNILGKNDFPKAKKPAASEKTVTQETEDDPVEAAPAAVPAEPTPAVPRAGELNEKTPVDLKPSPESLPTESAAQLAQAKKRDGKGRVQATEINAKAANKG